MDDPPIIVGLGEALFDAFPDGHELLGGATLNVAVHAHQLGNNGIAVSRIGDDDRGRLVLAELARRGMSDHWLQIDPVRSTSVMRVTLRDGQPSYALDPDPPWDAMALDEATAELARTCDAVCFGTLAQRAPESRATIQRFVQTAAQAVRLIDVNLRLDHFTQQTIERSLALASAAKMNHEELAVIDAMLALGGGGDAKVIQALRHRFDLDWVALTRGPHGTLVCDRDGLHETAAVPADTSRGDAVGAGDAVSAALLHGAVRRWPWDRTLALANAIGAHVASLPGACPSLSPLVIDLSG